MPGGPTAPGSFDPGALFSGVGLGGAANRVFSLSQMGPTEQQTQLLNQIMDEQLQRAQTAQTEQARTLSGLLGSGAGARGIAGSTIDRGQRVNLGSQLLRNFGDLTSQFAQQNAAQQLAIPQQNAALGAQLLGMRQQDILHGRGLAAQAGMAREQARSQGGLGGLLGGAVGSFLGPVGTALGSSLGSSLFDGGGRQASPMQAFAMNRAPSFLGRII